MKKAYKILTPSSLSFVRTFNKLAKYGFVWTSERHRKFRKNHFSLFESPEQILIGTEPECKMVMVSHANLYGRGFRTETISLKDFLKLETSGKYGK